MALLWIDGFDAYGGDGVDITSVVTSSGYTLWGPDGGDTGNIHITASANTRTGVGFSMSTFAPGITWAPACGFVRNFAVSAGVVFGFALKMTNDEFTPIVQVGYNNLVGTIGNQLQLSANGQAGLTAQTGDGDLVAASPPNCLFPGIWQYIEVLYTPCGVSGGLGSLQIKIDGAVVINVTDAKTSTAAYPSMLNSVSFLQSSSNQMWVDDLYICDQTGSAFNTYLGDCVVHAILPDADAGPNSMTQTGGSAGHFSSVDDQTPPGDSSYLSSATSGQQEMFGLNTFPTDIIDVLAMGINVRARKTTAGYANYEAACVVGSTEADGSPIPTNLDYETTQTLFPLPPGGGAWTTTMAQAAVIGFKLP